MAAVAMLLSSCATMKSTPSSNTPKESTPSAFVGPPPPNTAFGPEFRETQEVLVIVGPGMASALSGAGVIRALHDQSIQIAAVAGVEFGAMITAAYATAASPNKMDWSLLQFQRDWVRPKEGLTRLISNSPRSSRELHAGLKNLFREQPLNSLRVPLWVLESVEGRLSYSTSGLLSSSVCRVLTTGPWLEPCDTAGSTTFEKVSGSLRNQWERVGLRMPVIWVIPARIAAVDGDHAAARIDAEISAFAAAVEVSRADQDLVVTPPPVISDYFAYGRRSEVIYSGRQEAKKHIEPWLSRMGWTRTKRSP